MLFSLLVVSWSADRAVFFVAVRSIRLRRDATVSAGCQTSVEPVLRRGASVHVVHAPATVVAARRPVRPMPAATRNASTRSGQCNPARVRRCLRIFFGHLFSNLGLFALVVGYVLLGALLFEFLEAGYELEQRGHIQQYREDCLKELWLITGRTHDDTGISFY